MATTKCALQGDDYLSVEEVRQRLFDLDDVGIARIDRLSRYLVGYDDARAADFRQEAYVRLLSGRRRCRRKYDIANVVIGIVESMQSAYLEAKDVRLTDDLDVLGDVADETPSPEQQIVSQVDDGAVIRAIDHAVGDDPELVRLYNAVLDGYSGQELQQLLRIDATQLATLRRKLKRRLEPLHQAWRKS